MNRRLSTVALAAAILALVGCELLPRQPQPSRTTTLHYKLPILTPVEMDKQDQEKDGIRISVAPYSYTTRLKVSREYCRAPTFLIVNDQYPADVRETPSIDITPGNVRFKVKVYNRLERVLRLAGTVVSFQVAGKTKNVSKASYENFLSGTILPRQETEYEIDGPDLAELGDNETIAFLLYDIVTATDPAGNATKRNNFEFYYTLSRQDKEQESPVSVSRVMLNRDAAGLLLQRDGGVSQWVSLPELDNAR